MEEKSKKVAPSDGKVIEQLGILVLDGSGSMGELGVTREPKATEVQRAVRDLVERKLKGSTRRDDFWLSIIAFDEDVEVRMEPTPVVEIEDGAVDYNPIHKHGGLTYIGEALNKAREIAEDFFENEEKEYPRSVRIILMSDGCNTPKTMDPIEVAENIKALKVQKGKDIEIFTVGYGRSGDTHLDEETLKDIATEGIDTYKNTTDPEELREFFEASFTS